MIRLLLCSLLSMFLPMTSALAQQRQVTFRFDRPTPGVAVPHYSIVMRDDGGAVYHADLVVAGAPPPQAIDKTLEFSPATVQKAFAAVALIHESGTPCAAKMKNIADTGTKTVSYRGPDGQSDCTFNYTENKGAVAVADLFEGVETTLEAGRALDFKRRFDRLGLDTEMASLSAAAEEGRAQALEVIAPTLRTIAGDPDLIERVRIRAGKLLERTTGPASAAAASR